MFWVQGRVRIRISVRVGEGGGIRFSISISIRVCRRGKLTCNLPATLLLPRLNSTPPMSQISPPTGHGFIIMFLAHPTPLLILKASPLQAPSTPSLVYTPSTPLNNCPPIYTPPTTVLPFLFRPGYPYLRPDLQHLSRVVYFYSSSFRIRREALLIDTGRRLAESPLSPRPRLNYDKRWLKIKRDEKTHTATDKPSTNDANCKYLFYFKCGVKVMHCS